MSLIDFAGYAGLVLAIAASLDFITKDTVKQRLATRMLAAAANRANGFRGSDAATRFFGVSLLSRRAITRYAALSLISLLLTYGFAYLTTPDVQNVNLVRIFQREITATDALIFFIAILSALIADILSYSQARIFLSAVDRYKSPVVSLGLVVADGLISIGLFSLCFSVARFAATAIVMSSNPGPNIVLTNYYQPAAIDRFIGSSQHQRLTGKFGLLQSSLMEFERSNNETLLQADLRRFDSQGPKSSAYLDRLRYSARVKCQSLNNMPATFGAATDSSVLLGNLIMEKYGDARVAGAASTKLAKQLINTAMSPKGKCTTKVVVVTRSITQRDLLFVAGLGNALLAALERTAFDTYTVASFKFSPYVSYDPYTSQEAYLASLRLMVQQTFLGMFAVDSGQTSMFDPLSSQTFPVSKPRLLIPFSPMLASCLTVTFVLCLYLIFIILVETRNKGAALVARIAPSIDLSKTIFTSFALVITGIWAVLFSLFSVGEFMWSIVIG